MRSHLESEADFIDEEISLEKIEKMTRHKENMLMYMEDIRMKLKAKNKQAKKLSQNEYTILFTPSRVEDQENKLSPEKPIEISELSSLEFLMTPRILNLSLKNEMAVAYIFHLSLMPKSITPFVENFIFEWKSLNNLKIVGYINLTWIKYVHSESKNRFCIVCYNYENKDAKQNKEKYKYAHFSVPNNNTFNDCRDGIELAKKYIENLNYLSQKFKENAFINYQRQYMKQ